MYPFVSDKATKEKTKQNVEIFYEFVKEVNYVKLQPTFVKYAEIDNILLLYIMFFLSLFYKKRNHILIPKTQEMVVYLFCIKINF